MTNHEIRACLKTSPLLRESGIPASRFTARSCRKGQIISDRSDGRDIVGMVAEGEVMVYAVALDGRDVALNSLRAGDCFGVSNLLAPADLETVLRCRTAARLLMLPKEELIAAMKQNDALMLRYAALCNHKIQFLIRRIELLTMQSCRGKFIEYLLFCKDRMGKIQTDCSRDELARRLGVSRAALFRELSALQAKNLLQAEGNVLHIVDEAGLEQLLYQRSDSL